MCIGVQKTKTFLWSLASILKQRKCITGFFTLEVFSQVSKLILFGFLSMIFIIILTQTVVFVNI